MAQNPFQFGRELDSTELVDRADEVRAVVSTMRQGGKLFLIGPRRYGKTSVLRAAEDRIGRHGTVLRYDAEAFTSLTLLAARILGDTASRLTSTVERAGVAIREFFASVRPVATYNATENKWSVSLAGSPGRYAGAPLLADVLDGVERAARKTAKPVAVVIDEFQKVVADGGVEAEGQIRSAIQKHRKVGYVFAGSNTKLLADMTADPRRPFYKLGQVRFIGELPKKDLATFLQGAFAEGGIRASAAVVDAIIDLAEGVPYNVQLLAYECWNVVHGTARTIESHHVLDARASAALHHDPIYAQLWSALPATQQKALLALRRGHKALLSKEVAQRYDIPTPAMQRALAALEAKGIIREERSGRASRLRLEDPLFGTWIELVVPQ